MRPVPGWQLLPFPKSAIDDDALEGITWTRIVPPEWIEQNIPDAINEPTTTAAALVRFGTAVQAWDGYLVRQTFLKPSRRFRQGETAIMVGDKIYRRMGQLPFYLGKRRIIPMCVSRFTKKPTSWWGESFLYQVVKLNRELNRALTLQVRRALMKSHPGYLLVPQGGASPEDFKKQVGGIISYRPPIGNPNARPEWLTPPPSSADNDIIENRLMGLLDDVSSQHASTQGGPPGGRVDANSAIQTQIRQDMIPAEPAIRNMDRAIKRCFGIGLEIGRLRWDQARMSHIAGPTGGPQASVQIDPRLIPSMDDIEIATGLDVPIDKPSLLQLESQWATAPFKGGQPLLTTEEFRRGIQAIGVNLPGIDLVCPDEEQAWLENVRMYGDGVKPGAVQDPDPTLENSEIHLAAHKKFVAGPEVHNASPDVQAMFVRHIQLTGKNLSGSSMPPQFDADYQLDDSKYLQAEIASQQAANAPEFTGVTA